MDLKKALAIVFALSALISCDKDGETEADLLASYTLRGLPRDSRAEIVFSTPLYFSNSSFVPGSIADPDSWELLMSEDLNAEFTLEKRVTDEDDAVFQIDGLTNGTPYYFSLRTVKKGLEPAYSDTIMLIPSRQPEPSAYLTELVAFIQQLSFSPDNRRLAFITGYLGGATLPDLSLYIYEDGEPTPDLVQRKAWECDWSPAEPLVVYSRSIEGSPEVNKRQLAMYVTGSDSIYQLPIESEYPSSPTFSNDGQWVYYVGRDEANVHTIWRIGKDGSGNEMVLDSRNFTAISAGYEAIEQLAVSSDNQLLYFSALSGLQYDIFRYDTDSEQLSRITSGPWNDKSIALSPDNSSIAFVSERSGYNEVWVFHFDGEDLQQLTGGDKDLYVLGEKLEWVDDRTILFSAYKTDYQLYAVQF